MLSSEAGDTILGDDRQPTDFFFSTPTPTGGRTVSDADMESWWLAMAERLGVRARFDSFFGNALGEHGPLERVARAGGDVNFVLFVLLRYWIPPVLPPPGRERMTKSDPDYWLESEQILRAAVVRLRELKPLIELLTASNPLPTEPSGQGSSRHPVVEVELAQMLAGIAEVAGSYAGPDYTSVIKHFDPVPLRQTQPFKHNKKNSAELWVVFLLREHFKALGFGKDRYWPLVADVIAAAGISQSSGLPYSADELKSWWQKNWPRTYNQLEQQSAGSHSTGAVYQDDFQWFRAWLAWQLARSAESSR